MTFTFVSIEGNIGSGKSTLLKNLKNYTYDSNNKISNKKIIFLKEPVAEWETIRDAQNKTMVEKFYADQSKYSFSFQMMAYISRLVYMKEAVAQNPNAIIITERCLNTDKEVFAKMLYDSNMMEDVNYQIYLKWFDAFAKDFPIKKIIYVKADPEVCQTRVNIRNRNGEEHIPIEYLSSCHNYHEKMIEKANTCNNVLILNGNIDINENKEQLDVWLNDIINFIQ
jgi:deoxyadenosine/deoxycytidine kinase